MAFRIIPHGHVMDVTITVEEGLLLSGNPLSKLLITSAMARAQYLFPLRICHVLVESTHIHFLIIVDNPDDIPNFLERFKTESAHYINRMLGRQKRTIWCDGYFSAPILTLSSAIRKIIYIYSNPAKDNLEDSIEQFPGYTSWKAYRTGRIRQFCPRMARNMIPYFPNKSYSTYAFKEEVKRLKRHATEIHTLVLSPDAWMEYFRIFNKHDRAEINDHIVRLLDKREAYYREKRKKEGKSVIGRDSLKIAHLDLDYVPRRTGKKMWCICDNKDLRIRYIQWAKEVMAEAREVYERWKRGDYSVPYPPGLFPPARPKVANMTTFALGF